VKTPIEHDTEFLSSDLLQANPSLLTSDGGSVTIKQTNEEGRKRYTQSGDVVSRVRGDFKETLIEVGHSPVVTAKGNYESEVKTPSSAAAAANGRGVY
jgi:hypothetical protein